MDITLTRAERVKIFHDIWRNNAWCAEESRSGPGSGVERTHIFRAALEDFLHGVKPSALYDAPCGDFNWMRLVRLPTGTRYIGADIVPELIDELCKHYASPDRVFMVSDIVSDPLPQADVWLCRESLFHLPLAEVSRVLERWRTSTIRYFLATTTPTLTGNENTSIGSWRCLNLEAAPFQLGPPIARLPDAAPTDPDKVVGVWENLPPKY